MTGVFADPRSFWELTLYDAVLAIRAHQERIKRETQRGNIHDGYLLATILNTVPRKNPKAYRWSDFYPDLYNTEPGGKKQTPEQIYAAMKLAFGGESKCRSK